MSELLSVIAHYTLVFPVEIGFKRTVCAIIIATTIASIARGMASSTCLSPAIIELGDLASLIVPDVAK